MKVYEEDENAYGTNPDDVLNVWKRDFENLYNISDSDNCDFDDDFLNQVLNEKIALEGRVPEQPELNTLNINFSLEELNKVCNKLKSNKATGPDSIPYEVLKNENIRVLILNFFNKCFDFHIVPGAWQEAIISPIPKSASKDPFVPLNYRGISLLSCFYKIYSSLLNSRLSKHCEINHLLVDEQNGFRPDRSCVDHVFSLSSVLRNRNADKLSTFACFIDMRKAFDWVHRDMMLFKLMSQYNVNGKLYEAIKSIYSSSHARVKLNSQFTPSFNITAGVKQGDNLSPTLFSLYLNDLAIDIKEMNCGINIDGYNFCILLYADDIVLVAPSESKLQSMIDKVSAWCRKWRMVVNNEKTQTVHFRPKNTPLSEYTFMFNQYALQTVNCYKYLGVYFDEFLSFDKAALTLSSSARRALGFLRYKLRFLKECRANTFTKLYSSYICPILDYASGAWAIKPHSKIEQVQFNALRYFFGVHRFAPLDMLTGDSGWLSCHSRQKLATLRLWNRLISLSSDRITNYIFRWDIRHCHKRGTWSNYVRNILYDIDLGNHFDNAYMCSLDLAYSSLIQNETHRWNESRYSKPKLRYYNMFKPSFEQEEYFNMNISKRQRSLFSQFRAGILPLNVETGRFRNIDLPDRVCTLCPLSEVEDEYHFLCICPTYSDLREILFAHASDSHTDFPNLDCIDKFVFLLSNMQYEVILFIERAYSRRCDKLFVK